MPDVCPRHTIIETPLVKEALDELRLRVGGERIDYAELVVLGARMKARQLPNDTKAGREAAQRLAEMIRQRRVPIDLQAAEQVKHLGLNLHRGGVHAPCPTDRACAETSAELSDGG